MLEANANPFISYGHDMANAAAKAGLEYNDLIQRNRQLGNGSV